MMFELLPSAVSSVSTIKLHISLVLNHPGAPIFHEGSKGYTCCKRRVLEFDQFMKIEGCKTKDRHLFVGSGAKDAAGKGSPAGGEELLETVR